MKPIAAFVLLCALVPCLSLYRLTYAVPSDLVHSVCGWPRKVVGEAFRKAAGLP